MKNSQTLCYYEKLHDIFERIHPNNLPEKFEKLIEFIEEAAHSYECKTGQNADVLDVVGLLHDMKHAFSSSLIRTDKSILLTCQRRDYEVNIYPILKFLKDNTALDGEINILKMRLIQLADEQNVLLLKDHYQFLDSLSIVLAA